MGFFKKIRRIHPASVVNRAHKRYIRGPLGRMFGIGGGGGSWLPDLPQPKRPEFLSLLDPKTGLMKDQYKSASRYDYDQAKKDLDAIQLDQRGIEAFRERALSQGPSAWAKLAEQKQKQEESNLLDQNAAQVASANAQAMSGLAMRGGVSAGARERAARAAMDQLATSSQGVRNQGMQSRLDIGIQDDQQRMQMLGALPGMEAGNMEALLRKQSTYSDAAKDDLALQQWNIEQALKEKRAKDIADMNAYNEQMRAWAGNQQGRAIANSGKK